MEWANPFASRKSGLAMSHPTTPLHSRARQAVLLPVTALTLATAPSCGSPSEPGFDDADVRILFVGNSLTYTNDLPAMVATIADVAGIDVSTVTEAAPDFSLQEHWYDGITQRIRSLEPDLVVLQQGPSSLPQNQLHLRAWADSVARAAHEVGAVPALFMVWPATDRLFAFDDVRDAYQLAAQAVGGVFVPAGEAWREVWKDDPDAMLYGFDGFHPSRLGSVVAALTLAYALLDVDPTTLPAELVPGAQGLPTITLSAAEAQLIYPAVARTVLAWRD
jgi:hypothetical protein